MENLGPALAPESALGRELPSVYGALLVHVATLIGDVDRSLDAEVLGGYPLPP